MGKSRVSLFHDDDDDDRTNVIFFFCTCSETKAEDKSQKANEESSPFDRLCLWSIFCRSLSLFGGVSELLQKQQLSPFSDYSFIHALLVVPCTYTNRRLLKRELFPYWVRQGAPYEAFATRVLIWQSGTARESKCLGSPPLRLRRRRRKNSFLAQ